MMLRARITNRRLAMHCVGKIVLHDWCEWLMTDLTLPPNGDALIRLFPHTGRFDMLTTDGKKRSVWAYLRGAEVESFAEVL